MSPAHSRRKESIPAPSPVRVWILLNMTGTSLHWVSMTRRRLPGFIPLLSHQHITIHSWRLLTLRDRSNAPVAAVGGPLVRPSRCFWPYRRVGAFRRWFGRYTLPSCIRLRLYQQAFAYWSRIWPIHPAIVHSAKTLPANECILD